MKMAKVDSIKFHLIHLSIIPQCFTNREAIIHFLDSKGISGKWPWYRYRRQCRLSRFCTSVALDVEAGRALIGVLICGSANGVCMTVNKHSGIRAALCWKDEISSWQDYTMMPTAICLPARYISHAEAILFTETFLQTNFEGGRHQNRVAKIGC